MRTFPFSIVDAFCVPEKSFSGNPAAVVLLDSDDEISDELKSNIGAEINLSETAFVAKSWKKSDARANSNDYTIRWFTPTDEVVLCGHATLASAKVLFNKMKKGDGNETTINFQTKYKGALSATMHWNSNRISMNFPLTPVNAITEKEIACLPQLLQHLIKPLDVSCVHSAHYTPSTKYLLVRLHDSYGEKGLLDVKPDFYNLAAVEGPVNASLVTVKGDDKINFYSRIFAPRLGINEDPVTGSAHCALGAYWSTELNANNMLAKQCSKRGGYVYCKIDKSIPDRVTLEGLATCVVQGELTV